MNDAYNKRAYFFLVIAGCSAVIPPIKSLLRFFGLLDIAPPDIAFTLFDAAILIITSAAVGVFMFFGVVLLLIRFQSLIPLFNHLFDHPWLALFGAVTFGYGAQLTLEISYSHPHLSLSLLAVLLMWLGSFSIVWQFVSYESAESSGSTE